MLAADPLAPGRQLARYLTMLQHHDRALDFVLSKMRPVAVPHLAKVPGRVLPEVLEKRLFLWEHKGTADYSARNTSNTH